MGPIQVCVHVVRLVDQLIDLPNSALKSECLQTQKLYSICVYDAPCWKHLQEDEFVWNRYYWSFDPC